MSERLKPSNSEIQQRIEQIGNSEEIQRGLMTVSQVGMAAEAVLYGRGIPNLWLPPLDTSISEYSNNDFVVTNPLNSKKYSLIQSPQSMKEIAALAFGSNWRRATCFRPEPGDATHAQMFQQIDVELRDMNGREARQIAGEMLINACTQILGENNLTIPEYDYQTMIDLYGIEDPNLHKGPVLDYLDGKAVMRIQNNISETLQLLNKYAPEASVLQILEGAQFGVHGETKLGEMALVAPLTELREMRKVIISETGERSAYPISAYWLVNLPFASFRRDGSIKPTHHVMSMPHAAISESGFSFSGYTDEDLTRLRCDSYDLVLCNNNAAIEIAGGDVRIPTASLQEQAIDRFRQSRDLYRPLLDALEVNERRSEPHTLAGFAFGIERLAMTLGEIDRIDKVQIFPVNSPTGDFIHAEGYKE